MNMKTAIICSLSLQSVNPLLAAGCLALLAAGCASGPKYSAYRPTLACAPGGSGRIWFYRPSALGAAVQPAVKLDGQPVGNAVPHGYFHVEAQPGPHEVSTTTEWTHKTMITVTTNSQR